MVIGFGILFVGMNTIESSFAPFAENMPAGLVRVLDNPIAGFFIGVIVTVTLAVFLIPIFIGRLKKVRWEIDKADIFQINQEK